jgi:hypothetical protein
MLKRTLKISLALMLLSSLILAQNKLYIEGKTEITGQKNRSVSYPLKCGYGFGRSSDLNI